VTGLRCVSCGLVYEHAGRQPAVASCRRCGGELQPLRRGRRAKRSDARAPVVAVRSAVTGRDRLPIG
jgi:ribosomal protein L34E